MRQRKKCPKKRVRAASELLSPLPGFWRAEPLSSARLFPAQPMWRALPFPESRALSARDLPAPRARKLRRDLPARRKPWKPQRLWRPARDLPESRALSVRDLPARRKPWKLQRRWEPELRKRRKPRRPWGTARRNRPERQARKPRRNLPELRKPRRHWGSAWPDLPESLALRPWRTQTISGSFPSHSLAPMENLWRI